jgi:polyphosphate kinase
MPPNGDELAARRHRYLNRELSAADFDERVLELAYDESLPLLERVRFLSIVAGNLDEFFMVRVAGLENQLDAGDTVRSIDGRSPIETLAELRVRVLDLVARQDAVWLEELRPALANAGILVAGLGELNREERRELDRTYSEEIFPILTPLAVGPGQAFPYVSGLSLSLALLVRTNGSPEWRLGRVKVPESLPRFLPFRGGSLFVPIEEVIEEYLPTLYPGAEIAHRALFRVTRDADFEIEDEADDLLEAVESKLRGRSFGDVVRLELAASAPDELVRRLQRGLGIGERETYRIAGLVDGSELSQLANLDRPSLKFPPWEPVTPPRLRGRIDEFLPEVHRGDVLVQHPYDSFTASVGRFLTAAAEDPSVLALKTTVYRTNQESPLGPALGHAVEAGKQAVCLVELKARFDEKHNIEWSRRLERAGVHVVYGFPNLKIHAKMTLVVRRDEDGVHRYAHIGTGNYHALTAGLYEDLGLFTADPQITADVADLFNYLTGLGDPPEFRKLVVAPWGLRRRILAEIDRTIDSAERGQPARIRMKLNALTDEAIIDALYRASQKGVRVQVIARGVCSLRPGIEGMSENITVRSVLGRFLEHSRFYLFQANGETTALLGSGDLMTRNMDRRIEVLTPIENVDLQLELERVFRKLMRDTRFSWELEPSGEWRRRRRDGEQPKSSQSELMRRALERASDESLLEQTLRL